MELIYKAIGDRIRMRTYSKAISAIAKSPPITSGKQAIKFEGIGKGISKKIDQILATSTCCKLQQLEADSVVQETLSLTQVWGVGPKQAQVLREQHGISNIDQLTKKGQHLLTSAQKVGLKYCDDIQLRIPRLEVSQLEARIQGIAAEFDARLKVVVCGSYRRGASSSGDVDVLITHPEFKISANAARKSTSTRNKFLAGLVSKLTASKLLVASLCHGGSSFMGVCKLSPTSKARRLDILMLPYQCFHYGTLHFTGSDDHNVALRETAIKLGYKLSQYDLVDGSGEAFPAMSERCIFKHLKLPYKEPCSR